MPDAWHNCDGTIGLHLRWISPNEGNPPTWAILIADQYRTRFLPVAYCPICGRKLEPPPLPRGDQ